MVSMIEAVATCLADSDSSVKTMVARQSASDCATVSLALMLLAQRLHGPPGGAFWCAQGSRLAQRRLAGRDRSAT